MRPSCLALGVLVALAAVSPASADSNDPGTPGGQAAWQRYAPPGSAYQVELPGRPTVEEFPALPDYGLGSLRKAVAVSPTAPGRRGTSARRS